MPGIAFPEDFGPDLKTAVNEALLTRRWAIDWWEGDPRDGMYELDQCYYVRPATKHALFWPRDGSWGGECTFLSDNGCQLEFSSRPKSCRMLEPASDGHCDLHGYEKGFCALAWLPHQNMLEALLEELTEAYGSLR